MYWSITRRSDMSDTTRRTVLAGAAGLTAAVTLAACGDDDPDPFSQSATPANRAGASLGATVDIPVGGGKVFAEQKIVVTQPSAGQFKAFSTMCPHAGCDVTSVNNGVINCPCHGSQFKIEDGSVKVGPATKGLTGATVKVNNGNLVLG
jgi:Rieske Fe-S protein